MRERHDEEPDDFVSSGECRLPRASRVRYGWLLPRSAQVAFSNRLVSGSLFSIMMSSSIIKSALSGHVSDQCVVDDWLAFRAEPTADEKLVQPFATARKWLQYVLETRGKDIANAWFIGRHLAGQSPGEAIRAGRFGLVEDSARERAHYRA